MALATCNRCQAVFIVDADDGGTRGLCPYCGREMEPAKPEEVQQRIQRRRPSHGPMPPDAEMGGLGAPTYICFGDWSHLLRAPKAAPVPPGRREARAE